MNDETDIAERVEALEKAQEVAAATQVGAQATQAAASAGLAAAVVAGAAGLAGGMVIALLIVVATRD
jgi:hypothetical protein